MTCSFVSKKGLKFINSTLPDSEFCYLKSHYVSLTDHIIVIDKIKKKWIDESYPISLFSKHNVSKDGWCFYTSFGMALLNIYKKTI